MGCSSLLGPFCFEDESVVSIPFMLMEGIADVKVLFMNWTQRQYFRLKKKKVKQRERTPSTRLRTRSFMGSESSLAEGGKWRSSFSRATVSVFV